MSPILIERGIAWTEDHPGQACVVFGASSAFWFAGALYAWLGADEAPALAVVCALSALSQLVFSLTLFRRYREDRQSGANRARRRPRRPYDGRP